MNDLTIQELSDADSIRARILTIRGVQVMFDRDLAELYGVPTKALSQAVKRNANRFPEEFTFQIDATEKMELVTNCDRFKTQYGNSLTVKESTKFHDRFLIIDKSTLIHVGASLNHLGKKCFAFASLDKSNIPSSSNSR